MRERSKHSTTNDTVSQNLAYLFTEYQDVFLDKLPKGLLPARVQDFHIELKTNAELQKKELYRMSEIKLEEVKAKINEFLKWDTCASVQVPG